MSRVSLVSMLVAVAMLTSPQGTWAQGAAGQGGSTATKKPRAARPAAQAPATPSGASKGSAAFQQASAEADKAREENRLDDASALYQKALALNPKWVEGWFHLGTIAYDQNNDAVARDAMRRVVQASPGNDGAWAVLGLTEFRLKDYDQALMHLMRARSLGVSKNAALASIVRYHASILLGRNGEHDQALQMLNEFAVEGDDSPRVIEAFGINALRLPVLPSELPGDKRDAVMMAGRAQYFSAARMLPAAEQAFAQLAARYPELPNVHYAFGVFLLAEEPDKGVQELERELKISPGHVNAMLSLAFEYIKRSDYDTAKKWAQQAVSADPTNFVAHKALGQVLLETGDTAGAIAELEAGVKMAPDSPAMRFQLAKAYQKAGRTADAERERAEFTRLDRAVRSARTGSQSVGGAADSSGPDAQP